MRLLGLLACLICLASSACQGRKAPSHAVHSGPNTLVAGTHITTAGSWGNATGATSRQLTLTLKGNAVNWNFSYSRGPEAPQNSSWGSYINLSSPSDPWFIHSEGEGLLWFFNGMDELIFRDMDRKSHKTSIFRGELRPDAAPIPPEVLTRLPADLQKRLPAPAPKTKTPSI